jgi:hypothetical protein
LLYPSTSFAPNPLDTREACHLLILAGTVTSLRALKKFCLLSMSASCVDENHTSFCQRQKVSSVPPGTCGVKADTLCTLSKMISLRGQALGPSSFHFVHSSSLAYLVVVVFRGLSRPCLFVKPLLRLVNQSCYPNDACVVDESGRNYSRSSSLDWGCPCEWKHSEGGCPLFCRQVPQA